MSSTRMVDARRHYRGRARAADLRSDELAARRPTHGHDLRRPRPDRALLAHRVELGRLIGGGGVGRARLREWVASAVNGHLRAPGARRGHQRSADGAEHHLACGATDPAGWPARWRRAARRSVPLDATRTACGRHCRRGHRWRSHLACCLDRLSRNGTGAADRQCGRSSYPCCRRCAGRGRGCGARWCDAVATSTSSRACRSPGRASAARRAAT